MLHLVCLSHRRGNQKLKLLRPTTHLYVLKMDCASSVANQDISPETALRIRINWPFILLAAEMAVTTI